MVLKEPNDLERSQLMNDLERFHLVLKEANDLERCQLINGLVKKPNGLERINMTKCVERMQWS